MPGKTETIVTTLEQGQSSLLKWMAAAEVTSVSQQKEAEDMLIHARQALRNVEAKRKGLLQPVDETRDRINALFKPLSERLNMAIFIVNKALQSYHTEQVRIAEEQRMALLAEQAARLSEAQETGEVVEPPSTEVIPHAPSKTSRAHLGSVTYREEPDVTIVNPFLVPRELCDPNISRIRARAKSGVTEIPGVLITIKYITVTRGGR